MRSTDVAPAGASSAVEHRTSSSPARAAPPISPAASLSAVGRFNQFLSSIAMLPPAADFFAAAATAMAHLIGARFLGLSLYDAAANTLTCHALVAPPELACALREHRAQSPLGATIDIPSATARQALLCGKLQSILHDDQRLVFGQVSAEVCERIKSALGITTCYAVGMTWRGAIVGCIMFAMPDAGVLDADLVEACAHQVAALYQQRTTERARRRLGQRGNLRQRHLGRDLVHAPQGAAQQQQCHGGGIEMGLALKWRVFRRLAMQHGIAAGRGAHVPSAEHRLPQRQDGMAL